MIALLEDHDVVVMAGNFKVIRVW